MRVVAIREDFPSRPAHAAVEGTGDAHFESLNAAGKTYPIARLHDQMHMVREHCVVHHPCVGFSHESRRDRSSMSARIKPSDVGMGVGTGSICDRKRACWRIRGDLDRVFGDSMSQSPRQARMRSARLAPVLCSPSADATYSGLRNISTAAFTSGSEAFFAA